MSEDNRIYHTLDPQLSDREVFLVGKIIVEWGALEHEIFSQTLLTFADSEGEPASIPQAMNNLQATELLNLWKQRVVDHADGERAQVLQQNFDEILDLKKFRDALVHGMWHWSGSNLSGISTTRVRRKEVITAHFSADDLDDFTARLASINFSLRFPGGLEDLARSRAEQGHFISRRGLGLLIGDRIVDDWFSKWPESDS